MLRHRIKHRLYRLICHFFSKAIQISRTVFVACNAILFLLVVYAWPSSYYVSEQVFSYFPAQNALKVSSAGGWTDFSFKHYRYLRSEVSVSYHRGTRHVYDKIGPHYWAGTKPSTQIGPIVMYHGFPPHQTDRKYFGESSEYGISIPYWLLLSLLGPPLLLQTIRRVSTFRRRRRRRERGECELCGYDLRASAGICPECGTSTKLAANHEGGLEKATPE